MHVKTMLSLVSCLAVTAGWATQASGQNTAPFSIRFPPDGATVREKVPIRVPLASIPEGAYVAFSIDGIFRVALAPTDEQRQNAKPGDMFEYVWDTKEVVKIPQSNREEAPADGPHKITAVLFVPRSGAAGGADIADTSEVTVTLANKITTDPGPLSLKYRFEDGSTRTYQRTGTTAIVGGVTQGLGATGDVELIGQNSDLLLAVEDVYANGNAIVRNRLTRLAVKQGGQEIVYPQEYLPRSIYQEVDPFGVVLYPPQDRMVADAFWQAGIPISATLDLPILPRRDVRVGDTWDTPNVVLDIPGTAPELQPKVTVKSTLEGLEWEGNHQTARIVQTYEGTPKEKSIVFGNIVVENPQIKFRRVIHLAYRSGTLVKIERTLEVSGTTSETIAPAVGGGTGITGPGAPPMMGGMSAPGGMMAPGLSGPPMMGPGGMSGPPIMMGGMGQGGSSIPMPGGRGMGGDDEDRDRPFAGSRGMRMGGRAGRLGGLAGPPMPGMPGGRTGMTGPYSGYRPGMGGVGVSTGTPMSRQKITLRSKTVTELKPEGETATK